ncbi:hypothetical protein FB451DRAFT_1471207 [Mycena latifolia]|nr:hypothetical protein FB451DRAFT_1471207 [Mycena latifolia]
MDPTLAVHRLPHDILHDLFILCNDDAISSGIYHFSVVLSHVCSSWRTSALATPTIWRSIYTRTPSSLQECMRVWLYLDRSDEMCADVSISVFEMPSIPAPEFDLLDSYAHKIRRLSFWCKDPTSFPALLKYLPVAVEFPALEWFHLGVPHGEGAEIVVRRAPSRPSQDVTPLRLPTLMDTSVRWSTCATTNITHLRINGLARNARPSMESLWHIFAGCKSTLELFEFRGSAPVWEDENSVLEPVVLPRLCMLVLLFLDDLAPLAGLISAPNLYRLDLFNGRRCLNPYTIDEETDDVDCDVPRMLEHLRVSGSALIQMYLYCMPPCPRSTVDRFYAALPALEDITLFESDAAFQDGLFQPECRFRTPREPVFPLLSYLMITDTVASDLGRFLLRHKTLPVAPLRHLYMTYNQRDAAYEPTRSILGYILDMCIEDDGLRVICAEAPRPVLPNPEPEPET